MNQILWVRERSAEVKTGRKQHRWATPAGHARSLRWEAAGVCFLRLFLKIRYFGVLTVVTGYVQP